jgi:uncharacterized RDD family membrane protein YckC
MKRKALAFLFIACPALAYANDEGIMIGNGIFIPEVIVRTLVIILLFYVAAGFLLTMVRLLLNYRLKSKMIHMGIVGDEAERMLKTGTEAADQAVKWLLLLLFSGIGFTVIGCFPFGWLSVGIMAFSLSLGFAGYYFYLIKRKEKL